MSLKTLSDRKGQATLENISLFSREEKIEALKKHITWIHQVYFHSGGVSPTAAHVFGWDPSGDIDWGIIDPILEKIVDDITQITRAPKYQRLEIIDGKANIINHAVDTISIDNMV